MIYVAIHRRGGRERHSEHTVSDDDDDDDDKDLRPETTVKE
jgi:hypothetical protein